MATVRYIYRNGKIQCFVQNAAQEKVIQNTSDWLTEAVANNAAWCNAVATSHGTSTEWNESVWLSEHPMPRFYPNIVTLTRDSQIDQQIDSISTRLPVGWGIKDSFSQLALDGKGFALAFDAHWYCRVPNHNVTNQSSQNACLKKVKTEIDLNRWVAAWGEGSGIFKYSLLDNTAIELVYVERNDQIVCGLAVNLSGDSVGISNTFGPETEIIACIALLTERYPAKGIVGYGSKVEIETLSRLGFQGIGELRVWLRE